MLSRLARTLLAALVFLGSIITTRAAETQIDGQVFIATSSGENIKLGLVLVRLYPAYEIKKLIAAKERANAGRIPRVEAICN